MEMIRKERGSVLFISMMVILVLAALGMVIVEQIYMELANSGNFRVYKQGTYITEAGLMAPIAQAAQNQALFLTFLQQKSFVVRPSDFSPQFFDFSRFGSFGPEFAYQDSAQFITYFSDPVDVHRVPGYSLSGFCYRKYTVTADGYLGVGNIDINDPESVKHTAQSRFVAHIYLGPIQCGL